jgi:hypothetical protein
LARYVGVIGNSLWSMVARFGVIFPASMADIFANRMEICFGSIMVTSTTLPAATSPATPIAAPSSDLKLETHPPKPCDIV